MSLGPKRQWSDAREKVERERVCRHCGSDWTRYPGRRLEAAHTAGRSHDRPKPCPVCNGEGVLSLEMQDLGIFSPGQECDGCAGHGTLNPAVLYVHPDDIVPLCGPATDSATCHGRQHVFALDLLPLLSLAEQLRAVENLAGIENARVHLAPSQYPTKAVRRA